MIVRMKSDEPLPSHLARTSATEWCLSTSPQGLCLSLDAPLCTPGIAVVSPDLRVDLPEEKVDLPGPRVDSPGLRVDLPGLIKVSFVGLT